MKKRDPDPDPGPDPGPGPGPGPGPDPAFYWHPFMWLNERKYDIIFLQETYCTVEVEDTWRTQWRGKLFSSHGTNHSCGVMVLVRSDLDFNLKSVEVDVQGRYVLVEADVQGGKGGKRIH